jgi:hypothetical protein
MYRLRYLLGNKGYRFTADPALGPKTHRIMSCKSGRFFYLKPQEEE